VVCLITNLETRDWSRRSVITYSVIQSSVQEVTGGAGVDLSCLINSC